MFTIYCNIFYYILQYFSIYLTIYFTIGIPIGVPIDIPIGIPIIMQKYADLPGTLARPRGDLSWCPPCSHCGH